MKIKMLSFTLVGALSLSACQTWDGLKNDWNTLSEATSQKVATLTAANENRAAVTIAGEDTTCPPIMIDPQLDSMTEFSDMEDTKDSNMVSHVALSETKTLCTPTDNTLDMRLDLTFNSELGPKAKAKESDQPFFAYPYFISVTDGDGQELAKEIFAASITYDANQESVELVETINQSLPLNEDGTIPDYQIHIGFQLTEEQLFYNASNDK
jgi:hypothetical protein